MSTKKRASGRTMARIGALVLAMAALMVLAGCRSGKPRLTKEDVITLSQQGMKLGSQQFLRFEGKDSGRGVHLYTYPIDVRYRLVVGCVRGMEYEPVYIHLDDLDRRTSIDIRTHEVALFFETGEKRLKMEYLYPQLFLD